MSIADYLEENGYSFRFIYQTLYPMMFFVLSFNANLVSFFAPGYWHKVDGSMNRYLQSLAATLGERLQLNTPVQWVKPVEKALRCVMREKRRYSMRTSAEVTLALLAEATEK